MTRTPYLGASYIDAWPDGEYAVLYERSHIQTHLGTVSLPPGETFGLLYRTRPRLAGSDSVDSVGNTSEDGLSSNGTGVFEHELAWPNSRIVFVRLPR